MKRTASIIMTGCLLLAGAFHISAQENKNVKILGDHGLLDAVIQTPRMAHDEKAPLAVICHGFTSSKDSPLIKDQVQNPVLKNLN